MRLYIKQVLFAGYLLSAPIISLAADSTPANSVAAGMDSSFNPVLISLATIILLLLFVIAVLGNVLRQLATVYRDKMRSDKGKTQVVKNTLLLLLLLIPAVHAMAQDAAKTASETIAPAASSPFIAGITTTDFFALMSVLVLEIMIVFAMIIYMRILLKAISAKPELAEEAKAIVKKVPFWDKINAVIPIDKEQDIMLDHDYDGIRELDNSLPPWWKYGFYLTILISIVYIWYYHAGGNGPSSEQEYIAAVQKGEEEKAAYLAKTAGNIDENNVKMAGVAGIDEGKSLFTKNCAACHASDGGGLVGPNLTDDYWLHGGSIQSVFKSIKYGWQDKGMKSWKDDFSPKQLQSLASFVRSLHGTTPAAPKEKQGDLYVEGNAAPVRDTTKAASNNKIAVR